MTESATTAAEEATPLLPCPFCGGAATVANGEISMTSSTRTEAGHGGCRECSHKDYHLNTCSFFQRTAGDFGFGPVPVLDSEREAGEAGHEFQPHPVVTDYCGVNVGRHYRACGQPREAPIHLNARRPLCPDHDIEMTRDTQKRIWICYERGCTWTLPFEATDAAIHRTTLRDAHEFDPIHNGSDECECGLLGDSPLHRAETPAEDYDTCSFESCPFDLPQPHLMSDHPLVPASDPAATGEGEGDALPIKILGNELRDAVRTMLTNVSMCPHEDAASHIRLEDFERLSEMVRGPNGKSRPLLDQPDKEWN